jgi:hypothetical protein
MHSFVSVVLNLLHMYNVITWISIINILAIKDRPTDIIYFIVKCEINGILKDKW